MYAYVKPVEEHILKGIVDKKRSNLSKMVVPYEGAAECLFDDVRVQHKSDKSLPLQTAVSSQEKRGSMESGQNLFSGFRERNIVRLKQDADCISDVVQFTVDGIGKKKWLDAHKLRGKKRDLFAGFFDMVHMQSDFIFFEHELDSYYTQYEKENYAVIDQNALQNFDLFKKHVAMIRDPEGAHGAQRHTHDPQAGSRYIVDRVLAPRGPAKASYLPVDTYLEWDNKLIMHHEAIFEKYMEHAHDLVSDLLDYSRQCENDIGLMGEYADEMKRVVSIVISGGESLILFVSLDAKNIEIKEDSLRIGVKADVTSNQQVESISVTKKDANEQGIHGIKQETKKPEAYTGSLAPVFIIADGEIVNEASITSDMLKWVTKF